jgi:hypothetical protein
MLRSVLRLELFENELTATACLRTGRSDGLAVVL